jgi:hypothetical protein
LEVVPYNGIGKCLSKHAMAAAGVALLHRALRKKIFMTPAGAEGFDGPRPATDTCATACVTGAAQHRPSADQNVIESFKVRNIKYSSIDPVAAAVAWCRQDTREYARTRWQGRACQSQQMRIHDDAPQGEPLIFSIALARRIRWRFADPAVPA